MSTRISRGQRPSLLRRRLEEAGESEDTPERVPPVNRVAFAERVAQAAREAPVEAPRRKRSPAFWISLAVHLLLLGGASLWVVSARRSSAGGDAGAPAAAPESEPFPMMTRLEASVPNGEHARRERALQARRPEPERRIALPRWDTVAIEELATTDAAPQPWVLPAAPAAPPAVASAGKTETSSGPAGKTNVGKAPKAGRGAERPGGSSAGAGAGAVGEKPVLLRHPTAVFPTELVRQGVSEGTVVLEVEIDASGRVRVRGVVSTTHPALVEEARRVAEGSEFRREAGHTSLLRLRWPIIIRR